MRQTFIVFFSIAAGGAYAQSAISSGSVSGSTLIHSVGELYVMPVNANQVSSGTIGAVSRIEFLTLGIDEVVANTTIKIYPNPTANSVFFESTEPVSIIEIFDMNGRLIATRKVENNKTDLSLLQSGTYIIKTNNKQNQSFKIIKK